MRASFGSAGLSAPKLPLACIRLTAATTHVQNAPLLSAGLRVAGHCVVLELLAPFAAGPEAQNRPAISVRAGDGGALVCTR